MDKETIVGRIADLEAGAQTSFGAWQRNLGAIIAYREFLAELENNGAKPEEVESGEYDADGDAGGASGPSRV